jgi:hypothetical protein
VAPGKVLLEAQDVADLGAAPAVDRLIVVADAGDVAMGLREQAQPQILGDVGVLVLVDQDRPKALLVVGQNVRLRGEQAQAVQQQVTEVAGVQGVQPVLVGGIELAPTAEAEITELVLARPLGRDAAVLQPLDDAEQRARRPAARIEIGRLDHLLDQAQLVVGVEDREARLEPDQLGVAAQQPGAQRVEGAEPQALDAAAEQQSDAQDHLARRLVGEGHREHLVGPDPLGDQHVREPRGQHPGLAGAGAGQHQERAVLRQHRRALLGIEPVEIRRRTRRRQGPRLGRERVGLTGHETPH